MLHKKLITILRNLICLIGLICMSPFLFLAALALIAEDGMPVFFVQDRIGQNKKCFKIIKIRTLKNGTPHTGTHELETKHRLRVGILLRKTKLDEFPQLLNVLKGEINLIGPRPGLPNQDLLLKHRSDREVFQIKPGITGLAQVMGYDMSNPERLSEVDEMYISRRSLKINLLILLATFTNFPKNYLSQYFKIENISGVK
jgi:O-antigen biosynthesis protein WbqP